MNYMDDFIVELLEANGYSVDDANIKLVEESLANDDSPMLTESADDDSNIYIMYAEGINFDGPDDDNQIAKQILSLNEYDVTPENISVFNEALNNDQVLFLTEGTIKNWVRKRKNKKHMKALWKEARSRGYKSPAEMYAADNKPADDIKTEQETKADSADTDTESCDKKSC